jgi:hypothetical protein
VLKNSIGPAGEASRGEMLLGSAGMIEGSVRKFIHPASVCTDGTISSFANNKKCFFRYAELYL